MSYGCDITGFAEVLIWHVIFYPGDWADSSYTALTGYSCSRVIVSFCHQRGITVILYTPVCVPYF